MITLEAVGPHHHLIHGTVEEKLGALEKVNALVSRDGLIVPAHAAQLRAIPYPELWWWMFCRGVFLIPTWELIEELRRLILPEAIEIGAGLGGLGRALGIRLTDSHFRLSPAGLAAAVRFMQPPPLYPPDVESLEGIQAVQKYRPRTVVMSWVPHWDPLPQPIPQSGGGAPKLNGGAHHGIRDELLMGYCDRVILVGTEGQHGARASSKTRVARSTATPRG